MTAAGGTPGARIPFVDEVECVGCNLCELVCPVSGCISMVEKRRGPEKETWNDRIKQGTDQVPGGLEASKKSTRRQPAEPGPTQACPSPYDAGGEPQTIF